MRHRTERATMLGRELDILMNERQTLLQVVGAGAALVATLDSASLPSQAVKSADLLAMALNALPEETLQDALAAVRAQIDPDERIVSN